mmetsp:Transcript_17929/g.25833  ORF Transcript_17929/g.25833 Transcript_17929/m.25833 type:complete len:328 (-) Transcript_17929:70-1053(-)|eukprot:CAMPEP_0202457872 /NCGR_PEP_ID=MMETSP1360-20130828/16485_1 /ASSEMBLY_ACC=CAM_ASM_000848 /TAXON_ID=515479 /ORGANISM="Licmophora paradoxa, Strain CCMP2313" /LENGTH=327 /DNA_ID=CAMNT_0049078065 /DNA_START=43 /DNA_END=1026 /DNA_ORIENTATION=+
MLYSKILAFCVLYSNVAAFTLQPAKTSSVALRSTSETQSTEIAMFPDDLPLQRIEGGETLRTFKMPIESERCQMVFKTMGRPLRCRVEMWLGPQRKTHMMDMDIQDGQVAPFRACLKFKKGDSAGAQVLTIRNMGTPEFPLLAGVVAVTPEKSKEFEKITNKVWQMGPPTHVQGGTTVRSFPVADNVEAIQLLVSSKRVSGKSVKMDIEVLQGANYVKQRFDLQVGGGCQPYHAIIATPGQGVTIRMISKNVFEFPYEVSVVPYSVSDTVARVAGRIGSDLTANTFNDQAFNRRAPPPATDNGLNTYTFGSRRQWKSDRDGKKWWEP